MKRFILMLTLVHITFITSAQSFFSNQIKFTSLFERIDFYDAEDSSKVVSVAPKFYKVRKQKKRIKPIKVNDKTYFIKIEKFGVQAVYTENGEHVANMERDGSEIHLLQDNSKYTLLPRLRLADYNTLECYNAEKTLVSKMSWNNDKRLVCEHEEDQDTNLLLMALCIHQYQELLLGDRGRLTGPF